jgi:BirA family biotin operon repressor/biotin-[acetyl-CoA-carboxylase] ligase
VDVARVRGELTGTRFADVRWVRETGSTNTDVLELARQGEAEGTVVVADHQTAGRGRRGRTWEAPAGAALMATVLVRPPAAVAGLTTMALAVAAADAVAEVSGASLGVKWPNDLVWPGDGRAPDRKVAGILAEADWPASSQPAGGWSPPGNHDRAVVAAGIGINVAWGRRVPDHLRESAVALDEITAPAPAPDRAELLVALLRNLHRTYGALVAGPSGAEDLLEAWRVRSATLGRRVRVDLGHDDVVGTAVDVTAQGHLVVELLEGGRRILAVGDVVHLRPESGPQASAAGDSTSS